VQQARLKTRHAAVNQVMAGGGATDEQAIGLFVPSLAPMVLHGEVALGLRHIQLGVLPR
jgi:hypothetical protein